MWPSLFLCSVSFVPQATWVTTRFTKAGLPFPGSVSPASGVRSSNWANLGRAVGPLAGGLPGEFPFTPSAL